MSTTTVNPVVNQKKEDKLTEVKVTVIEGQEQAIIVNDSTVKVINLAFGLQDDYENESQYRRDSLQDAAVMFLKAECNRVIARWDNLVTKLSKTPKYKSVGRDKVEEAAKDNPKCKPFYNAAQRAITIRLQLK